MRRRFAWIFVLSPIHYALIFFGVKVAKWQHKKAAEKMCRDIKCTTIGRNRMRDRRNRGFFQGEKKEPSKIIAVDVVKHITLNCFIALVRSALFVQDKKCSFFFFSASIRSDLKSLRMFWKKFLRIFWISWN